MNKTKPFAASFGLACVLFLSVGLNPAVAFLVPEVAANIETVALSAQPVPEVDGASFDVFFRGVVLNNRGKVSFFANLANSGPRNGVFTNGGGSLTTLALVDTPVFGGNANTFSDFYSVQIDDFGRNYLHGRVNGLPPEYQSLAVGTRAGDLAPIAESGGVADSSQPEMLYYSLGGAYVGSGGHLAGLASASPGGVREHCCNLLFVSDGGPTEVLLRVGDQPDFTPPGGVYINLLHSAFERPVVNSSGTFTTRVETLDPDYQFNFTLHIVRIDPSGNVERVVTEMESRMPDPNVGTVYELSYPVLNDHGDIGFGANSDDHGPSLWRSRPGETPTLVVKASDEPPTLPGGRFTDLYMNPTSEMPLGITGDGSLVFIAQVTGDEFGGLWGESLWIAAPDGLRPIAVEGRQAPGVEGVFASMDSTSGDMIRTFSVNERNQVAFTSQYQRTPTERATGLFATDGNGELLKVAAPGDIIEVSSGDFREIHSIDFRDDLGIGISRSGSGFNDLGQIAFSARFTDGSGGVFISNIAAIPEPSAWIVAASGCLLLLISRSQPLSPLRG